ncbi:hypothetical protein IFM89_013487 [Coptis chinensis]|uniref:Uncharacterized protein n=1 Tax=Coptis chinensis TaxID=261450 RepID=A0A835IBY0_9MAGN|nr:hypothetical protein IFM89_013487 [Coptis chinensis]
MMEALSRVWAIAHAFPQVKCCVMDLVHVIENVPEDSTFQYGKRRGKKVMSPCDVEALKKCLEENKGDRSKCQSQVEAFKDSCSLKKPKSDSSSEPTTGATRKPSTVKIRRGVISDV